MIANAHWKKLQNFIWNIIGEMYWKVFQSSDTFEGNKESI
jgi:hypothetical protein